MFITQSMKTSSPYPQSGLTNYVPFQKAQNKERGIWIKLGHEKNKTKRNLLWKEWIEAWKELQNEIKKLNEGE